MKKLTKEQAAVISAYTGYLAGSMADFHTYAEGLLGRPIYTHEFAQQEMVEEVKSLAKADFLSICAD